MNDTMQCSHAQNLFSAYFDQDLDPAATRLLEKHFASCALCKEEWNYFQKTMQFVHEELPVAAPADILSGVHQKLSRSNPLKAFWHWLREFDFSLSVPAAATTVAVVFVAAISVKFFFMEQKNPTQEFSWRPPIASTTESGERPTPMRPIPQTQFTTSTSRQVPSILRQPDRFPSALMDNQGKLFQDIHGFDPPYGLLAGSPNNFGSMPDIVVTVHTNVPDKQSTLYQSLLRSKDWRVLRHNDDLILIYVKPHDFSKLQQTMEEQGVRLFPGNEDLSPINRQKSLLSVAVRLK